MTMMMIPEWSSRSGGCGFPGRSSAGIPQDARSLSNLSEFLLQVEAAWIIHVLVTTTTTFIDR
jgi:hypothetical protein